MPPSSEKINPCLTVTCASLLPECLESIKKKKTDSDSTCGGLNGKYLPQAWVSEHSEPSRWHCSERCEEYNLAGGNMSLEEGFDSVSSHPVSRSLSLPHSCGWGCGLLASLLTRCLLLTTRLPCHGGLLSLWNHKPN